MKATFAAYSVFACLLMTASLSSAEPVATYKLSCTPSGSNATATLVTVVQLTRDSASNSGLSGTALMNISLQNTDGSAPFVANNIEVHGQIQDAANSVNNKDYQVLFAQPAQGCNGVTYARIAIGDDEQTGLPNSYIRDANGVYYYAHCQDLSRKH